jgi:hypothetical protein
MVETAEPDYRLQFQEALSRMRVEEAVPGKIWQVLVAQALRGFPVVMVLKPLHLQLRLQGA